MLRAIFFDIDDTLFSTSEFAAAARRNAVRVRARLLRDHSRVGDSNRAEER